MNVTVNINEAMLAKLIEEMIAKSLFGGTPTQESQIETNGKESEGKESKEIEALHNNVTFLTSKITILENEINELKQKNKVDARLSIQETKPMATQHSNQTLSAQHPISQALQAQEALPRQAATQPVQETKQVPKQSNGQAKQNSSQPDEAKADKWTREHVSEWINQVCSFAKSEGRTWRELAENKGEKITMKGKQFPPRAYLHSLENWKDCNLWSRLKAKVALEIVPSKNGVHPVGTNA